MRIHFVLHIHRNQRNEDALKAYEDGRGGKCAYMFRYTYAGMNKTMMTIKKGDRHRSRIMRTSRAPFQRRPLKSLSKISKERRYRWDTHPGTDPSSDPGSDLNLCFAQQSSDLNLCCAQQLRSEFVLCSIEPGSEPGPRTKKERRQKFRMDSGVSEKHDTNACKQANR